MHTRTTAVAALAVLALTLTACSSGGDSDDDTKASTATASSNEPTSSASPTQDAAQGPLKLGTGHHWTDTDTDGSHISGTTTAISYSQPATGVDLPDEVSDFDSPVWAVLEVKVCADEDSSSVLVAQDPWALGFSDDTRLQAPGTSGSGVPKPEYPTGDGALVKAGTCLRGKITFSVGEGTRPDQVIYAPADRDPVEWAVPKA
ncbi:hypothetical protein KVH27_18570 [Streptomyces olivaceus]|uniref:hypothetical protein n=1 Tax=Streptomyces olivaceus TaxID=47716 RepID=UPI001CC9B50B|nr:hypothetical protein [Streptomyces olivaceus]MBZ6250376.1 hypothetical protein [Streptomyces olivaceus]